MKPALLLFTFVSLIGLVLWRLPSKRLLSPLSTQEVMVEQQVSPLLPQVYGFMPYWNVTKLSLNHSRPNTIIYSGISLNEQGMAVKDPGLTNLSQPAFMNLKKAITQHNQQLHLSFMIFSTETIDALLASKAAQSQAIATIVDMVNNHQATGINLDFEPNTQVNTATPQLFTQFATDLKSALRRRSLNHEVTIDIFGRLNPNSLWQLKELSGVMDAFVLMAYDYHHKKSDRAGPVAPLYGSTSHRWNNDVMQSLRLLRREISHEKIILGIPFYGYEWRVVDLQQNSQTFPGSGVTATYDRVQTLMITGDVIPHWDKDALSPWLTFTNNNQMKQIYFEDQQSIAYKVLLAQQAQLKGVAIWALGYEGESNDLWQPFANILSTKVSD